MIRNRLRFLSTIRHLKLKQLVYLIYYKIKGAKTLSHFVEYQNKIHFTPLGFNLTYPTPVSVNGLLSFTFLNKTHRFTGSVDWNFQDNGKLWNYNLQYFNFLQQNDLTGEIKLDLLQDIGHWLEDGRLPLEPYPVSLRIMNSIRFISHESIEEKVLIEHVYSQLRYLEKNLEYHIMGNHLLENAFALMMGSHAFANERWGKKAKAIIYKELDEQVLEDGGHFELSPMYHQIILYRLLELIDWYGQTQNADSKFLAFIRHSATLMLSWLRNVTFSNGDIPHFNDSAPDIAIPAKEVLELAAQLDIYPDKNFDLGSSGYRKYIQPQYECISDIGQIKAGYQPGHTHADIFSFVLYHQGKPLVVDTGTSTYDDNERRYYERSTKAHNSVEVENENQIEVWKSFRVGRRANISTLNESKNSLTAKHDGYKVTLNAIHRRMFEFNAESIQISDYIDGAGELKSTSYLHFHPDCMFNEQDGAYVINNTVFISFSNASLVRMETYKWAAGFNLLTDAKVLIAEFKGHLKTVIRFI